MIDTQDTKSVPCADEDNTRNTGTFSHTLSGEIWRVFVTQGLEFPLLECPWAPVPFLPFTSPSQSR